MSAAGGATGGGPVSASFAVERYGPLQRVRMARTVLGRRLHEVSAWAVGGLLVDTGPPPAAPRLASWCRRGGIERVVLTHHHEDHCGGAALLGRRLGLAVEAPAGAVPMLAAGLRIPLYRRVVWGRPEPFAARPLPAEIAAAGLALRVIPTPGHAFDHVCLYEPRRRWLFSGDLYVHPRVRLLRRIEDVAVHLDSLRRVRALRPRLMLCSHAGPVEPAEAALDAKIRFWEELREAVWELADAGLPVRRVSRRLLGGEGVMTWLSLGDFSKRNLVRSLLAGGRPGAGRAAAGRCYSPGIPTEDP